MLLDVSNVSPYVVLGVVGVILLLAILKGLRYGIIQSLVNLVILGGIGYGVYLMTPKITPIVAGYGFLEQIVALVGGGSIFEGFLTSLLEPAYTVITGLALILVGFIVFRIITYVIRLIFRKKKLVSRILGAIYNLAFNGIIVAGMLMVFSSPLLFKGGEDLINRTVGVSQFYNIGVVKIQELLRKNHIPATVEDLVFKLLGADFTAEEANQIIATLEHMNDIMADPEAYFGELFDDDGNLNEEMLGEIITDLESFSLIYEALPDEVQEALMEAIVDILDSYLSELVDPDTGDPITYDPTPEEAEALERILDNMPDLPTDITDLIYDIFGVGSHS